MYKLTVSTLYKGDIELTFTDFEKFVKLVGHQIGLFHGYINEEDSAYYCSMVSRDYSKRFQEREQLGVFDNISSNSTILDIGSGVGILDLVLYKYIKGGNFFLLDKSQFDREKLLSGQWNKDHGFYNDWNLFIDFANHSNINLDNFTMLSPEDNWPKEINLITSSYSYMWHYPKDIYWHRIKPYALLDTQLCFDIANRPKNIMIEISEDIKKLCVFKSKPRILYHWFKEDLYLEDNSPGKVCYWA